ncbi:hypothetical protein GNI_019420 [Gregarina niphandrodes]|uniref:Uncharacterized protein n=1 Tax=Gregarina niphandrodes TaxID=110365 RepID=A0A023BBX7_GRENI|nr:hypothetical protein GNI_019420 [Gregarina niphandrodes]EZG81306.1 hypothetical protein GNI_019420 [Gregarina niphandrodes]|eukprot:XP_011134234.1 hypothetical protein GNI_019420 [Gregarina niphandrodes]
MARVHKDFLVKDILIGQILGDVPRQDRPAPIFSRNELMEFGFKAKLVKTFVEGGDRPETTDKNTVQQQTD